MTSWRRSRCSWPSWLDSALSFVIKPPSSEGDGGFMIDFYEKLYQNELLVKDQLVQRMQMTLGVFLPVAGFFGFMLGNVDFSQINFGFVFFISIGILSIPFCINFFYDYLKAWHGHEYHYLPTAIAIHDYHKEVKEEFSQSDADVYMLGVISKYYAEAATKNSSVNQERSHRLYLANRSLVWILLHVLTAGLIFVSFNLSKPMDVHIVNFSKKEVFINGTGKCS